MPFQLTGLQQNLKIASTVASATIFTVFNFVGMPAFADTRSTETSETLEETNSCQQHFDQPIALVFQDDAQNPDWQQGRYQPTLSYGSLETFRGSAEILFLTPEGHELSNQELVAMETRGLGGRFFFYFLIPAIAQEVIETYLEQNTTPWLGDSSTANEWQIRSIAREVCLDWTFGLGAAWGICDFFGNMIDQVVYRVWEYYQEH